jgi:hypothetical protein
VNFLKFNLKSTTLLSEVEKGGVTEILSMRDVVGENTKSRIFSLRVGTETNWNNSWSLIKSMKSFSAGDGVFVIIGFKKSRFTPEHLEQYLVCNCEQRN